MPTRKKYRRPSVRWHLKAEEQKNNNSLKKTKRQKRDEEREGWVGRFWKRKLGSAQVAKKKYLPGSASSWKGSINKTKAAKCSLKTSITGISYRLGVPTVNRVQVRKSSKRERWRRTENAAIRDLTYGHSTC